MATAASTYHSCSKKKQTRLPASSTSASSMLFRELRASAASTELPTAADTCTHERSGTSVEQQCYYLLCISAAAAATLALLLVPAAVAKRASSTTGQRQS
jgi:hypothetical protein